LASGIKALFELPLPLIFVSALIGSLISHGQLWATLIAVIVVLIVCMIGALFIPEERPEAMSFAFPWPPFLRLVLMTGLFAAIIVGIGAITTGYLGLSRGGEGPPGVLLTGLVGLAGMALAVVAGVWASVRLSIGPQIRQRPAFVWWIVNRLAFLVAASNLAGFMLYFLQERFPGLPAEKAAKPAATAALLAGLLILILALPGGWLADRLGKKPLLATSGLLGVLATGLLLLLPGLGAIYLGGILLGAAVGLFYSASWAMGTALIPEEEAGRYLGLSNLAGAGAGAIGAYLGGPLADQMGYSLLYTLYAGLFGLSILALLGVRE
jgi:hypothetical protein